MATKRQPPKKGLTFTPGNHQYRLDGKPVTGVTTLIGVLNKEAIPKWAAGAVAEYVAQNADAVEQLRSMGERGMVNALKEVPWKKRDDAGERGTKLHDHAERLLRGEDVDVDDELVPVIENALDFLDDWHIEPLLIEFATGHRAAWYAGTGDLIARYRRPDTGATGVGIFDWKSGKRIYPETGWQLAAYAGAEFHGLGGDEAPLPATDASFGVHIRADGYDVTPFAHGPAIFDEFLQIRATHEIAKRGRGDWRKPGTGHMGIPIQKDAA